MINDKDFKLTFKPKGNNKRGKYYHLKLINQCVCCGTNDELTKHHVVPLQFRKYLPESIKSKNSFDVLVLCDACHNKYEVYADLFKEKLMNQYGLKNYTKNNIKINSYLIALKNHYKHVPEDRRNQMVSKLITFFDEPINDILKRNRHEFENVSSVLMRQINDNKRFVIMWREHFIEFAKPKFLPQEWYDEINLVNGS